MSACGFEGARGAFLSCKEKRRQQLAAALVLPLRITVVHNKNAKQARFVHAPLRSLRTMHSIEQNGPNSGCVEVTQVPLIKPEEFAGMGGVAENLCTVAKVL